MACTIYRTIDGRVEKLTPVSMEQFIVMIECFPNNLDNILVTPGGKYFLKLPVS